MSAGSTGKTGNTVAAPAPGVDPSDRILLVDDSPMNLDLLAQVLDGCGAEILVARGCEEALRIAREARPQLVLLDIVMPEHDGYETCQRLKADPLTASAAVIFVSALDDARDKVRGLELGAVDFVTRPFDHDEVLARVNTHLTIQRLKRELVLRNERLALELGVARELNREARRRVEGALIGDSPAILALRAAIAEHARTVKTLLLTGPEGAGQEAVARAIHHQSARGDRAFIHVDCALLSEAGGALPFAPDATGGSRTEVDPAERELRAGKFQLADGGTLYLSGVHRLPPGGQQQLVGLLQNLQLTRRERRTPEFDVRVIAWSPRDLADAAGDGKYDRELHERLARRQLRVPPLSERREDIVPLALAFARVHAQRLGKLFEGFSAESAERLTAYRWPGNVRELQSVVERSVSVGRGPLFEIDPSFVQDGIAVGSYRLLEKLGQGAMGEVWRAKHHLLARPAAIKLIRPELIGSDAAFAVERFRREAMATAQLESNHTVRLFDFGIGENGSFYYVMELLTGLNLATIVERFGALPPGRVVALMQQACRSLAEAHASGLVHRDIKPANLFVARQGVDVDVLKVLDFGIVKSTTPGADPELTADNMIAGTPAYMAPEVILRMKDLDARVDIYSLGCVAWFLLTGRKLFPGSFVEALLQHVKAAPPPPSSEAPNPIPESLDALVLACLGKERGERPQTAEELEQRLGEIEVEPWTRARARAWWQEHLPELARTGLAG